MTEQLNFKDAIATSPVIFAIGVAGDSGSGKTTFTRVIREIFGEGLTSTISLDDYHIYDRTQRRERNITPLSPQANDFDLLVKHLADLKQGKTIEKPVYSHTTGTIEPPVPFTPTKILILEGLHTFATPALRRLLDFTIFVDPSDEVKASWKLARDMRRRGYAKEEVLREMEVREPDYRAYVAPQRGVADAIISVAFSRYGREKGEEDNIYAVTLLQEKQDRTIETISLTFDLFSMCSLSDRDFLLEFREQHLDGRRMGAITFDGELQYGVIHRLERTVEEQTGVHPISMFAGRSYVNASDVIQLILSWRIINKRIYIAVRGDAEGE
ncbi:MAG: phosphoribulokinase [Methanomicrobiaceae archaeon]|nr:phosphoribulokinase [Methanomicrobiaceae archaeon]